VPAELLADGRESCFEVTLDEPLNINRGITSNGPILTEICGIKNILHELGVNSECFQFCKFCSNAVMQGGRPTPLKCCFLKVNYPIPFCFVPMVNQNFLGYKWNGFLRRCFFPILDPAYWLSGNKQPIEIGAQISPPNQPIGRLQSR